MKPTIVKLMDIISSLEQIKEDIQIQQNKNARFEISHAIKRIDNAVYEIFKSVNANNDNTTNLNHLDGKSNSSFNDGNAT